MTTLYRIIALAALLLLAGCTTVCGGRDSEGRRQRDVLNDKLESLDRPTMGWGDIDRTIALTNIDILLDILAAEERQAEADERAADAFEKLAAAAERIARASESPTRDIGR